MSTRAKTHLSHLSIDQIPRSVIGVYSIWCRDNGKCIYVGQAKDRSIRDRLKDHWNGSHSEVLKLWIKAFGETLDLCYLSVKSDKIDRFEKRLIGLWKPEANVTYSRR